MALRFLFISMLCTICLVAHAQQEQGMKMYRNKQKGFSIKYPSNWIAKDKVESPTVLLLQSPIENFDNDYREDMELQWFAAGKAGPISLSDWIGRMKTGHEELAEVVRGRGKIGANQADWVVFTMMHWGFEVKCIAYLFHGEFGSHVLICTSVEGDYERHQHLFREVAESFKLL
jgi:hypothetical protein